MNEKRRERLATLLQEALPEFFESEIERLPGTLLSVLYVEVIESGTRANIFVSVFPDEAKAGIAKQLKISENKATHFIRRRVSSKYSPFIRFQLVEKMAT